MISLSLEHALHPCVFLRRLNRFVVEIEVGGRVEKAHLTNTGRLLDYLVPGRTGLCYEINSPKLKYRLLALEDRGGYAVIDTLTHQKVFEKLLVLNQLPWIPGYINYRRNPRIEGEVFDYMVITTRGTRIVELKSSVLRVQEMFASYPDTRTDRGVRQIYALAEKSSVLNPIVVFAAFIPDVSGFKPYCRGDPRIMDALRHAKASGVDLRCISGYIDKERNQFVISSVDLPVYLEC